jgi:YbbR domain-containing protein
LGSLLKDIIVKNSALKFFSLLLAITLWFFVMGEKKAEFSFSDVPLSLINKPEDLIITDKTADRISLRVSGSRTMLSTLSSSNLETTIDLEGAKPGTTIVRNLADRIKLPNGTRITSISPAECSLTLEPLVTKQVPIQLTMEGNPEEGYEIFRTSITPEFVEVSLAKSEAKTLKEVKTEPLNVSAARESIEKEIALVLTGLEPPRSISEKKIHAAISIREKIIKKTMNRVAVRAVNSIYKTTITPPFLRVMLKGPYSLVNGLSESTVSASIDLRGIKPGRYSRKVEVALPENVSVVELDPSLFKIVVSKEPLKK